MLCSGHNGSDLSVTRHFEVDIFGGNNFSLICNKKIKKFEKWFLTPGRIWPGSVMVWDCILAIEMRHLVVNNSSVKTHGNTLQIQLDFNR